MSRIITQMKRLIPGLQLLKTLSQRFRIAYSKEEINNRIKALNDAIATLQIALLNIRKSIPAEMKWPVKTKKILTEIRNGIPADISETTE